MKQLLKKVWSALNAPLFDIIGGFGLMFLSFFIIYFRSELSKTCIIAFVAGMIMAIGVDCVDHGFSRSRKSSGSSDDNKNDN